MSEDQKTLFITSAIPYFPSSQYSPEKLHEFAVTQDLVRSRVTCFGQYSEDDICKSCYLAPKCIEFTKYQKTLENPMDISNLGLKETSRTYQIAKIILEGNNRPFDEVITQIKGLLASPTVPNAKIRFYQARKLIKERLGVNVTLITKKFIEVK